MGGPLGSPASCSRGSPLGGTRSHPQRLATLKALPAALQPPSPLRMLMGLFEKWWLVAYSRISLIYLQINTRKFYIIVQLTMYNCTLQIKWNTKGCPPSMYQ